MRKYEDGDLFKSESEIAMWLFPENATIELNWSIWDELVRLVRFDIYLTLIKTAYFTQLAGMWPFDTGSMCDFSLIWKVIEASADIGLSMLNVCVCVWIVADSIQSRCLLFQQ